MSDEQFENDVEAFVIMSQALIAKLEDEVKELTEANQHLKDTVKRLSHVDTGTAAS
jgi:hypothetical protein